jgi:hypothetical protein
MPSSQTGSRIVLSGISSHIAGLHWETDERLLIGREPDLDIVLNDPAMARKHAEVRLTQRGWVVQDLSNRNATFLNGLPVNQEAQKLLLHDVLHCGQTGFRVTVLETAAQPRVALPLPDKLDIETTRTVATLKSATQRSWEQALQGLTPDSGMMAHGKKFFALIRAGYHLCRIQSLKELLQSILDDTVAVFNAAQGAVLLYDDSAAQFKLHAYAPRPCPQGKKPYSLTLTQHCFRKGESFLCSDSLKSQWGGGDNERDRASVICALLRSPRKRLGVLHLGRRADQTPFNNEDLQLADALAASISAGVESAQIIERYRDPFLSKTATFVRRALELRDPAAGQHLQRVHAYAGLLAEELGLHPEDRKLLQAGALLHEMGHLAVPEPNTALREQALKAAALAESLPELESVLPIIRSQYEHWDGTGIPDGLAGEKIPLSARMVAIADAFDTLTTESGRTLDDALNELKSAAGCRFDPKLVEVLVRLRPRLNEQLRGNAESSEMSRAR